LEFEVWNFLAGIQLRLLAVVNELERGCIFATGCVINTAPRGTVGGSFVIPGSFLNEGTYTVTLFLIKNDASVLYQVPDLLQFRIQEVERPGRYFGNRMGAVVVGFPWTVASQPEELPPLAA
jgi:lipopolysaccharide transport system ATP-binding protein